MFLLLQSFSGVHVGAGEYGEGSSEGGHDLGGGPEAEQGLRHQHQPQVLAQHVGEALPGQRGHGRFPHLGPAPATRPLQRHRGQVSCHWITNYKFTDL